MSQVVLIVMPVKPAHITRAMTFGPSFLGVIHHRGYLVGIHAVSGAGAEDVGEGGCFFKARVQPQLLRLSGAKITGILLWMGLRKSLAAVVIMVQEGTTVPSGSFQVSQSPAMANGSPVLNHYAKGSLACGCFLPLVVAVC